MPKPSKIEPVHLRPEDWLKNSNPPLGSQEGRHFGVDCVVIRYSTDVIGEGPNLHVHPYDEIFHILEGRALFTVGERQFHLSPEWIQYDLPRDDESLSAPKLS